jgi:hypothetical protein
MARVIETTAYKFSELSENAKEKARDWWRQHVFSDNNDWDCIYEDAATIADLMGIDLRQRRVELMNGSIRYDPCIYFSGFSSQGDGACFEGTYRYRKGSVKAIKKHAPKDKELHRIVEELFDMQKRAKWTITATMEHRGHYNHSGCMVVGVDMDVRGLIPVGGVTQCMRDFADWIYDQLRKEYEYQMSDEQVDETLIANEYEFDEDGDRI